MRILRLLLNKYTLILLFFIVWVGFIDRNNAIRIWKTRMEIKKLELDRSYYLKEIEDTKRIENELKSNNKKLEKFARENYHMKKDDEEIIFIEQEKRKN
jgi:cell division protein FtsB